MRFSCWLTLFVLLGAYSVVAQEQSVTVDDEFVRSAEQWAQENFDQDALAVLQNLDRTKVRQFLKDIQKEFHGEYVVDLATLRDSARTVLPLLESYDETLPYALWLKTRLDYLDVANELRLTIPTPVKPGEGIKRSSNPLPAKEREIWISKMVERQWPSASRPYVARLKPIFTAQEVPAELVWLAELESSFDPRARSPAGAAGLFQLMPATAKHYGLRTWPFDERLSPEMSAQAAAQCLRHLHNQFKDWRLTLAAYNAGSRSVQNLLARRKAHSFDEIATGLPAETQMYVPKFEAILSRREGVKLNELHSSSVPAAGSK